MAENQGGKLQYTHVQKGLIVGWACQIGRQVIVELEGIKRRVLTNLASGWLAELWWVEYGWHWVVQAPIWKNHLSPNLAKNVDVAAEG